METNKSDTPGLDELKRLAEHLRALLGNSQPGLFTWRRSLSDTLTRMSDFAGHGRMSAFPELLAAMPTIPHPGGRLLKVVAYYADGSTQTIEGDVITAAVSKAKGDTV